MPREFRVGNHHVYPELNRVSSLESPLEEIQVEPKIMDVLVCLHEARGEVVSRDRLLSEVWSDTVVGDDVLTRAIGQLRKILGDDPREPRYIQTIPRRGYRLLVSDAQPVATTVEGGTNWWRMVVLLLVIGIVGVVVFQQRSAVADRVVETTRVFPITSFPGQEIDPTVSPDGGRVAFSARLDGADSYNLHVYEVASGETRQLTFDESDARHPEWSPDGRRLAYVSESPGCGIYWVDADGGIPQRIADCPSAQEHDMAWTADGLRLVLPHRESPNAPIGLALMSLSDGRCTPLTQPDADHRGDFLPAMSPDGEMVAFSRIRASGAEDIHVVSVGGGKPLRITFDGQSLTGLSWSEDGEHIIYSSHRAGVFALWQVDVDGGLPMLVLGGGDKIKDPAAARNANFVAFENWLYETNIWRTALDVEGGDTRAPLIRSTQWDLQPAYSPDGRSIAFVSTRTGGAQIWLAASDGSQPRRVTHLQDARAGNPCWSPDGTRLAFTVLQGGQTDIYALSLDGGPAFPLTDSDGDELAPAWTHDGQGVYFASRRSGEWQVWRISLDGGEWTQITSDGGFAARESLDGRELFYTRMEENGLWRMALEGDSDRRLLDSLSAVDWGNWAVAEDGICFVERDADGQPFLTRLDFDSGSTERLASADSLVGQGLSLSPDGRWLAYSRVDRAECDILAAEGLH